MSGLVAGLVDSICKRSVDQHILVRGAENDTTLYTGDGGLVTVFSWKGTMVNRGKGNLSQVVTRLREGLASLMKEQGHALQVTFSRDPLPSRRAVGKMVRRWQNLSSMRHLELGSLLEEREDLLNRSLDRENIHLSIFSHPSAISKNDHAEFARQEKALGRNRGMAMPNCQIPGQISQALYDRHEIYCRSVRQVLVDAHQDIRPLSSLKQAAIIAASLLPGDREEDLWEPRLLELAGFNAGEEGSGNPETGVFHRRMPPFFMPATAAQVNRRDMGFLGLEHLGLQMARDRANVHPDNLLVIDNLTMAGFDLVMAPELVLPFNDLLEQCLNDDQDYRWRVSFLLEPRGFQGQLLKRSLSEIFTFLSRHHNTRLRNSFRNLEAIDGQDDTVIRLRVSFALWSENHNLSEIRKKASSLRRAIERWGNCRTDQLTGDPLATVMASMPGNGLQPTAPAMALPLTHALALLPLNRPVSPWEEGSVPLITPDGRLWPYQPASNLQNSWCDLVVGTPGSGKSVLLNSLNLGALLSSTPSDSEQELLPLVGIIDIGSSAAGLVELLADSLPPEQQNQVQMARLSNTASQAINIFDTELGCRHPLPLELTFQENFLQILLADAGEISERLAGLIKQLVLDAYKTFHDEGEPKPYIRGTLPDLDTALETHGIGIDKETTWWELVDQFSDLEAWDWAEEAQRQAVPILPDLPAILRTPDITNTYQEMGLVGGEGAIAATSRLINEAVATWPLLGYPTRFAMSNSRLRMIDLQDVTGRGSTAQAQRRSALMYLLGRHVVTRGYFLHPEDMAGLQIRTSQKERLIRHATNNRQQPKRLCYDEFHRTGGIPGVLAQVETDVREGRKHNVQLTLASQLIGDFSPPIRTLATGFWICSSLADAELTTLGKELDLDVEEKSILRNRLGSPTGSGSNVFVILSTKEGPVRQLLINRLPPSEIWAFSTTAEDMALRKFLTGLVGGQKARQLLGKKFPGGSARSEITRRQNRFADRADRQAVIADLARELVEGNLHMGERG